MKHEDKEYGVIILHQSRQSGMVPWPTIVELGLTKDNALRIAAKMSLHIGEVYPQRKGGAPLGSTPEAIAFTRGRQDPNLSVNTLGSVWVIKHPPLPKQRDRSKEAAYLVFTWDSNSDKADVKERSLNNPQILATHLIYSEACSRADRATDPEGTDRAIEFNDGGKVHVVQNCAAIAWVVRHDPSYVEPVVDAEPALVGTASGESLGG